MNKQSKGIAIIAVGGGGSNMLNSLIKRNLPVANTMVVNSDKYGLKKSNAIAKLHMKGLVNSELSRLHHEVGTFMRGKDKVILLACLGGRTGSNLVAPIAATAKELNIPVLAIVSLPFDFEGKKRMEDAMKGLHSLEGLGVSIASFSNQQLMDMTDEDSSFEGAFELVNEQVWKVLKPYVTDEHIAM